MRIITEVVGGIFLLILVYLFLSRGRESVAIINAIASNTIAGIRALQGRG